MMIKEQNVQECDATEDELNGEDGYQKIKHEKYRFQNTYERRIYLFR
ncbi:MAG: hypothetical protein JWR18_3565 [Segetibacter sp.]|nr:hypothetical protein [Segetibacter sp.]